MKYLNAAIIVVIFLMAACSGRHEGSVNEPDALTQPDTGFTGIKQFMSGLYKVSEVTFKNGVRDGLTRTYYRSGKLQRTYWYEKGLRQDSSCWFYEEGQLFRTTPFRNDTIHGIQKQFYRTGELKAELGYSGGFRTQYFKEFTRNGKLVGGYPEMVVTTEDNYSKNGTYIIILGLSDNKGTVDYYRGEFENGVYDTTKVSKIPVKDGKGFLELKKSGSPQQEYAGIIASILTNFGNRLLVYKRIDLPYKDLK